MIHIGENEIYLCINNCELFDKKYLELIKLIKNCNRNCRIVLISVSNPQNNENINILNRHIKAIADSEQCDFVNLDNAHLWNPEATKAAIEFAQNMGLNTRKPLSDVAEILYSYKLNILDEEISDVKLIS